jgi:hypothetical protein
MLGINRKNGRLVLAALAGLGLAGVASQARASVVYSTGFAGPTFGQGAGNSWTTNNVTVDGLNGDIAGSASGTIVAEPSYATNTSNDYNYFGTNTGPANTYPGWQGAPNYSTNALALTRATDGSAVGVGPNLSYLPVNVPNTVTVSTTVGSVPASPHYTADGTGEDGPYVGLNLIGNNNQSIGSIGIDESTGVIWYGLGGNTNNLTQSTIYDGGTTAGGEYDQLQLVASFNGTGGLTLSGYFDGSTVFSNQTVTTNGSITQLSDAYMWNGTLLTSPDDNGSYTADFGDFEVSATVVPEPTTLGLVGVCGLLLAARRSRRSVGL